MFSGRAVFTSFPSGLTVSIGIIFTLHLIVLGFTKAPLGESLGSQVLQSASVLLVFIGSTSAARRSGGLARTLWLLASTGFAILFVSVIRRHFEHGEGIFVSDYMFLLYMVPFAIMLLLAERSSSESNLWTLVLDHVQIVIIAGVLFGVLIYIPSKQIPAAGATAARFHFIYLTFSIALIVRNLSVTCGFWFRGLTARSTRERSIFGSMATFLSIYTVCSVLSHYVFLHTEQTPQWVELQGTVPFLAGTWVFSRWRDVPLCAENHSSSYEGLLALHLIPATLPILVLACAFWVGRSVPQLAWVAVSSSMVTFGLRLLLTIRSEHKAYQSVREEEERYRSLATATTQIIWTTNSHGEIVGNQLMWTSFSGMSPKQVLGRGWIEAIHPVDRGPLADAQRSASQHRTLYDITCRIRRHDGVYREMAVRGVPVLRASGQIREWIGTCTDVTDKKEAEEMLRRTQDQYRYFLEQNLAGHYIATPEGRLLKCNPAFVRMFGFASEKEALEGNLLSLCVSVEGRQEFLKQLKAQRRVAYHEEEFRRTDKRPLYTIENVIGIFDNDNQLSEIQGFLVDQTERMKSQQALLHAQKMEIVGRLAGGISHDFNNLLCIIIGYSDKLLQYVRSDLEIRNAAREILDAAQRGSLLSRRLLAFSRKNVQQSRVISLNRVIEDIDPMLRRLIGENISVRTRLDPNLACVKADPNQLEQIILNLCVNARDAMPSGGSIAIETSNVDIDALHAGQEVRMEPGSYVRITVSDTGIGMDNDTLTRIFEPFFTTKAPGKGTGLGLAMVYDCAKQNGGYVWARSAPGKGSTFNVCFPKTLEEGEAPQATSIATMECTETSRTILLAEECAPLRGMLRTLLETRGYNVLEAEDGEMAIAVAKEHKDDISLLVTEVALPKVSGSSLASSLMLTGNAMKVLYISDVEEQSASGIDIGEQGTQVLHKPFSASDLVEIIQKILNGRDDASPSTIVA